MGRFDLQFSASRRGWLWKSAGLLGMCGSRWLRALAAAEPGPSSPARSVILLWMNGGPATIDLWDLKPGHANGGPFQEIETSAPGLKISEHLPELARWGREMAIIRSLTSKEGDHGRARQYVHTGYTPQPAIRFPLLGSLIAHEFHSESGDLPDFVSITPERALVSVGSGFLGPQFAPLTIGQMGDEVSGLVVPDIRRHREVLEQDQADRLSLLREFDHRFGERHRSEVIGGMRAATERAVRMMEPSAAGTFQLDQEPAKTREAYGPGVFGQGCLLARRLVERGVRFVEVSLDGWDTHNNNFERVKTLSQTLDKAFAALLSDLKERGLLDSTLVVCQGEFGRTPKINGNTGRDHWPGSWSTVFVGGGIRGGQAIGRTSDDGLTVEDRPVSVPDAIATICRLTGIDPKKQNASNVGRPIRIADPEAHAIEELL